MNIYDACNVKDLLAGYLLLALGKDSPERTAELLALEAAIRAHVIREASVGVVKLSHNGVASDYDIVPKETS